MQSITYAIFCRLNESGMVKKGAQLLDFRRSCHFALRADNVLAILTTSRIGTVRRRHEGERSSNAVLLHLLKRFGQHRIPVAISPINGELGSMLREFALERCDEFANLLVDRALSAEMVVMFRNREHTLARNIPSAQHVFEKWHYLFGGLRSAERDNKNGVVLTAFHKISATNQKTFGGERETELGFGRGIVSIIVRV